MRVRTHTNPFNFHYTLNPEDYKNQLAHLPDQIMVEIGCGRGVFLRHYAKKNPTIHSVGIEIRKPLVTLLNQRLERLGLSNASVVYGEGRQVITQLLRPKQIDILCVFHPDPWLKKRHHKRRIIHERFLEDIRPYLSDTARIYISTDVGDLHVAMRDTVEAIPWLSIVENDPFWETQYASHWHQFSEETGRKTWCLTAQAGV